jgi:small subunit ribosomal protein S9
MKKNTKNSPLSHGVGRRKSAVARVWLKKGKSGFTVNKREYTDYFDTKVAQLKATTPLRVCEYAKEYNIDVNVQGGGLFAQADAIKLGISRALVAMDEDVRPLLKENGLLTVDSRVKERKKYGQRGARRKFQFVKR